MPIPRQAAARVQKVNAFTTLLAQVISLTNMVKAMTTAPASVNQVTNVSCVYCGVGQPESACNFSQLSWESNFTQLCGQL